MNIKEPHEIDLVDYINDAVPPPVRQYSTSGRSLESCVPCD